MSLGFQSCDDIKAFSLPTGACQFLSSSQQVSTAARGKSKHFRLPQKPSPRSLSASQRCLLLPSSVQLLPHHPLHQVQLCLLHHKQAAATKNKSTKQVFKTAIPYISVQSFPTVNRYFYYAGP